MAREIRYLQGKGSLGSTTLVTEENSNGSITEHMSKASIERAILQTNLSNFRQSHHRPFYKHPLVRDFQFKGTTTAASAVLAGSYKPPQDIPVAEQALLQALQMPERLRDMGPDSMPLTVESYTKFWNTAE